MSSAISRAPLDGNIGEAGRRRRRHLGVVLLLVSVGAWLLLERFDASRLWRLLLLQLLFGGFIALLEARVHTCVIHAARGTCELDQRRVFEGDPAAIASNKSRAGRITRQAAMLALTATVLALILP